MKTVHIFILGLMLLTACEGGLFNDDHNPGTAPKINNVVLTDEFDKPLSSFTIGKTAICYVYATDVDQDMKTLSVKSFLPLDTKVPKSFHDIKLPPQVETTMLYWTIKAIPVTGPSGNWRLEFQITDARGYKSNVFKIFVVIHEA